MLRIMKYIGSQWTEDTRVEIFMRLKDGTMKSLIDPSRLGGFGVVNRYIYLQLSSFEL